jgi:hypothetical protein
MRPEELKAVMERLKELGFAVTVSPGSVDRFSRPASICFQIDERQLSVDERDDFVAAHWWKNWWKN